MKKHPHELEFISRIKRDGSGTEKLTEEDLFFFQGNQFSKNDLYELTSLSISEETYIASGFLEAYVVKLKPKEPKQVMPLPAEYKNVNRIEVINHSGAGEGREYVKKRISIDEFSLQDDGKTLKIFLK